MKLKIAARGRDMLGGYGIVAAAVLIILLSFAAISAIWLNVAALEQRRNQEHKNLAAHIAATCKNFLVNRQYDYFYETIKLLTATSFIDYIGVYVGHDKRLQSGKSAGLHPGWDQWQDGDKARMDLRAQHLYVWQSLDYHDSRQSSLLVVFSLREFQKPKAIIGLAFLLVMVLLAMLSLLVYGLMLTLRRLDMAEKTKADMIYSITHDARQDLFVIQGKLSGLLRKQKRGIDLPNLSRDLKNAQESSESIVRFLNNLSDQQRLSKGEVEMLYERVNVVKIIRSVMESFEEKMAIRGIRIEFVTPVPVLDIWADPQIVKRVLMNLLHNALKFSRAETCIQITLTPGPEKHGLTVRDQGQGIARENWKRVFQPYVKLNPDGPGMGLGLATARKLTRLLGGELEILDSEPTVGTIFQLILPAVIEPGRPAGEEPQP
jgi:signal transduction histidine kinase